MSIRSMTNLHVITKPGINHVQDHLLELKVPDFDCLIERCSSDVVINNHDAGNACLVYLSKIHEHNHDIHN